MRIERMRAAAAQEMSGGAEPVREDGPAASVYVMGAVEARFADLIWEHEPVRSGELVKLAAETLAWKKSTTYTVLKKLCEKGIFRNEDSVVTAAMERQTYYGQQSRQFVQENFDGSLPMFLAAFAGAEKLTDREVAALRQLIEEKGGDRV